MNPVVYAVAFAFGIFYGSRVRGTDALLLIAAGVIIAVLLGNYPHYPVEGVSTAYVSAVLGAALGGRRKT